MFSLSKLWFFSYFIVPKEGKIYGVGWKIVSLSKPINESVLHELQKIIKDKEEENFYTYNVDVEIKKIIITSFIYLGIDFKTVWKRFVQQIFLCWLRNEKRKEN